MKEDKRIGIPIKFKVPKRYDVIPDIVRDCGAKILLEIGVYKCIRSQAMILAALETIGKVQFFGFDLFEDLTNELADLEMSPKPYCIAQAYEKLNGIGVDVVLFKGFSRETLPMFLTMNIKPDFIFIDGGHSFETVESDWNYVKQMMHDETVVVFDDYLSACEDLRWGCNRVVDSLEGYEREILDAHDTYEMKKVGSDERFTSDARLVKVWKNAKG